MLSKQISSAKLKMAAGSAEQAADNPFASRRAKYMQFSTYVFCNAIL